MAEKKEYQIPVQWSVYGELFIKTDDIEKTIKEIEDGTIPTPEIDDDMEGSVKVDYELFGEMNPGLDLAPEPKPESKPYEYGGWGNMEGLEDEEK